MKARILKKRKYRPKFPKFPFKAKFTFDLGVDNGMVINFESENSGEVVISVNPDYPVGQRCNSLLSPIAHPDRWEILYES